MPQCPGTIEDNLGLIELGLHEGRSLLLHYEEDYLVIEEKENPLTDKVKQAFRTALKNELNRSMCESKAIIEAGGTPDEWHKGFEHGLVRASVIMQECG